MLPALFDQRGMSHRPDPNSNPALLEHIHSAYCCSAILHCRLVVANRSDACCHLVTHVSITDNKQVSPKVRLGLSRKLLPDNAEKVHFGKPGGGVLNYGTFAFIYLST